MISRRIHTNTKIFFPNPYVVRLEYPDQTMEAANADFMKVRRRAYKQITGTWGHSNIEGELITLAPEGPPVAIGTLYAYATPLFVPRAYFCFMDEMDVLQFRLSVDARAIRVYMWPSVKFTIHEFVEVEDVEIEDIDADME